MMVMEFTDVTMSSAYNNNQFPARNVLADDGTFFHTDRGVGQFWKVNSLMVCTPLPK